MRVQWENKIMSSFLQFVDHEILDKGVAYENWGANFYPADNLYNGYYTYTSPFQQFVVDSSMETATIPNTSPASTHYANIIDGVYVDGVFKSVASNDAGLVGINHQKGHVYFNQDKSGSTISGNFAVKDYSVLLTSQSEENLLFHTKHHLRPKVYQPVTGLQYDASTYPVIYIKNMGGDSLPMGLGGVENVRTDIRAVILSDSAFSLDAVCNILKDTARKRLPIITDTPFNAMGAYTGTAYNYDTLSQCSDGNCGPSIWNVRVSKIAPDSSQSVNELDLDVFSAFVDFEVHSLGQKS
tara:strand:- start:14179 stop:15069 length:891 start_codon:yes stop_codon:yes gene_type:complete